MAALPISVGVFVIATLVVSNYYIYISLQLMVSGITGATGVGVPSLVMVAGRRE